MALGALRNEPSIFVEWGACLKKPARCVDEAFAGAAKGVDEGHNPVRSKGPHHVKTYLKSRTCLLYTSPSPRD
eukprot:7039726-Alexandrium_andersonii.AAC.1